MNRNAARLALLLTLPLLPCAHAQTSPQSSADQPGTYQLNQTVRAVVLDIAVLDRDGHPVPDLTADDFQVTEDGTPQKLTSFQAPARHQLAESARQLSGPALLRASGDAPLTILLLDEISTEPEDLAFARNQMAAYLAKQPEHLPSPTTMLALTGTSLKRLADYTTERSQLLAAIHADHDPPSWYVLRDRQPGFKSTGLESSPERLAIYLGTLRELATATQPYPTRKNIIWIGPGLPALNQTIALERDSQQQIIAAVHSVVTDLVRARITLYTIDPQGLVSSPTQVARLDTGGGNITTSGGDPEQSELVFEQLAPATGGTISRLRNDVSGGIAASIADGTQYYTVSYTPTNREFNGSFRRIKVSLRRPELVARTREGYSATPHGENAGEAAAQAMAFALTSNLHYGGVNLTATTQEKAGSRVVVISVDAQDLRWLPDTTDQAKVDARLNVVTASVFPQGKVGEYHITALRASTAAGATPANHAELVVPYTPEPKAKLYRVLVRDQGSGRMGTFDLPIQSSK